ncbi:MAG TPA: hypothetical protein PKN81_16350 [Anaerolineales bacterium]|nr:hypothetical protein [Anaerolineales bacterium]
MSKILSRFSYSNLKEQLTKIWPVVLVGIFVSLGGAGITVLVAALTDNPIWKLAKDPAEVMQFPSYIGMLSNWGVLLWIASAVICLFGVAVLKQYEVPKDTLRFITGSGLLSLILGIDDLYRLHDKIFPKMFHLPEKFFYILYIFIFLLYLAMFAARIMEYEFLLFGAAFFLLVVSRRIVVIIPFFNQFMTTGDMLKYFGIVFWLAFFYRTVLHEITSLINKNKTA